MAKERYILEGEWSGYRSGQCRVVHRTVTTNPERYKDLSSIRYTDGTTLDLTLRKCKPRERVEIRDSYGKLIEKCLSQGVDSVDALYANEVKS